MPTKTFSKELLQELIYSRIGETMTFGDPAKYYHVVVNEIADTSRWSIHYDFVFRTEEDGKFWETSYSRGATESQDESPFENEPDEVVVHEVVPVEHTVVKYERVIADKKA